MARSKGERTLMREKKRKEKERLKRIEEANKMLIPVPKATRESLKLISFDPSGTFRFEGNRFVRIYRAGERNCGKEMENLSKTVEKMSTKVRFTKVLGHTNGLLNTSGNFVTLTAGGETYDEVRSIFMKDEEALRGLYGLTPLTVDDVFNIITKQTEGNEFSYASMVRGKKDWMKEFYKVKEESNFFFLDGAYGECLFSLQFPSEILTSMMDNLLELGCEIVTALELNPITDEDNQDFNRSLEKKYNKRLTNGMTNTNYINASYELLFLCDSNDAREIIEKTVLSLYSKMGFIVSPSIGMQRKAFDGILSFGLMEQCNMRNVEKAVIDQMLI